MVHTRSHPLADYFARHASHDELDNYAHNRDLSERDRERIEFHLEFCSDCRLALAPSSVAMCPEGTMAPVAHSDGPPSCSQPTTSAAWEPPKSSPIDRQVEAAVEGYFKLLRREAKDRAYARLYRLNALGVEWHGASRGLIYLVDERRGVLRLLKPAAFNSDHCQHEFAMIGNGIVPRVCRRGAGELEFASEGKRSGSDLAVPIYVPGCNKAVGVYLLEADQPGAFTPAQVRELQRQVIFFTPHLLVLEALSKADDFSTWPYHPELHGHGWSVEPMLTRFCRTVAASLPGKRTPACTIWNADWEKNRCWVLAAHGYDYYFIDRDTLGLNSAMARVARNRERVIEWGTPDELKFVCAEKAKQMGVREVVIASLHDYGEEPFSGTLSISFFDERELQERPSRGLIEWLAERAERLVASVHSQRVRLALAYLHCELAKDASSGHGFGALLRSVLRCLDAPVGSVFAREPNSTKLCCVETTGFEDKGDFRDVEYDLNDLQKLTCWAAWNPNKDVRLNWGPVEEGVARTKGQPDPSNYARERMVPEGSYRRRSMIKGVALLRDDPHPDPLGAIRVLRPGKSRPFTSADERLFAALAEGSKRLFTNWWYALKNNVVVQNFNSPRARIDEVVERAVGGCAAHGYPIVQASVFVRDERSLPEYRLYTSQYPPDRGVREELIAREVRIPKPSGEQFAPTLEQGGKIVVLKSIALADCQGMRVCAPIRVWSGYELVEAVLALDFKGTGHEWPSDRKIKVFHDVRKLSAIWASNPYWHPSPEILEREACEIVREYLSILLAKDSMIQWARLCLLDRGQCRAIEAVGDVPGQLYGTVACPDVELHRFGVRLAVDASYCVLPLLLGPFCAGEMVCGLDPNLASELAKYLPPTDAGIHHILADDTGDREPEAFQKLRDVTVRVTGPWCRVIAGNLLLWNVGFGGDREEQDKVIWNEEISLKEELLKPAEMAAVGRLAELHE